MDLMGSLDGHDQVRGITLNSQLIDLFNIIEQTQDHDDAVNKINEYLKKILRARKIQQEMKSKHLSLEEKVSFVVNEVLKDNPKKEEIFDFIMKNAMKIRANFSSREKLEKVFEGQEIGSSYIDIILNLKKYFEYETHGILTFLVDKDGKTIDPDSEDIEIDEEKTYQKTEALYEYVVGNLDNGEKRFNRLTLDGQGKFGTVAGAIDNESEKNAQPQDYNLDPLIQGYEFAKKHGMSVRINALVFFKDFPDRLVGKDKEAYKTALRNYFKAIASEVKKYEEQGIHTSIDMFNELVDYFEPFNIRTNNWMSQLSIEDLCELTLELKKEIPNADFGYNDWNFENSQKREKIFEVLRRIQEFEKKNNCKIIDHIGTQCHTSINDIEGFVQSIEELQQFDLDIDITELDISRELDGVDYKNATSDQVAAIRKKEQMLQSKMMQIIADLVKQRKIRSLTAWSLTDEVCCDFCDGKSASVTEMSYDDENGFRFSGKEIKDIEMDKQEEDLIEEHQEAVKKAENESINQNPIQNYCFHTHTERCGHAAKDTGDEEWIKQAIKGGVKKLAFTDHIPMPAGTNKRPNTRMDIAEVDSYLESIRYFKKKYEGQIEIETGFEFEYSDRDANHLLEMRTKVDKMILGQHFVVDKNGKSHPIERKKGKQISDDVLDLYLESIQSAADMGLPDVIAHPDLFMQARDQFGEKEEEVARKICEIAIEAGIPLEINLGRIAARYDKNLTIDEQRKNISYPCPEFWRIVAEETRKAREEGKSLNVIYGKDAHYPFELSTEKGYEIARELIGEETLDQLHIITDYKEFDEIDSKRPQTIALKKIVKEAVEGTPDLNLLDKIEGVIKHFKDITNRNVGEK